MNDIQGYQNGPIETGASRAKEMSPRAYNLAMSALIFLGFCAMGAGAYFTSTMAFARMMMSGAALPLVFGSFILTIVGIVMMSAAAGKQSVGLSLVGYVIFASTFSLTASFGLANYDLPTINTAFIATAAITFVFGALGVTFPKFFQRVYGIGFGILLATILVEIVLLFFVGFLPREVNTFANALVSFVCAMQVQTFRKVRGHAYASTMCIGNMRSGTEALCVYFHTHDREVLKKALTYFGVIGIFAVGAGLGSVLTARFAEKGIWVSCLLLAVSFLMMFVREEEKK